MKNKKTIAILILSFCVVMVLLFALINTDYKLSLTNIETKTTISLGEAKESIENKLGVPCNQKEYLDSFLYFYDNGNLNIVYDSNDCVALVHYIGDEYSIGDGIKIGDDIDNAKKYYKILNQKTAYFINNKCVDKSKIDNDIKNNNINYEDIAVLNLGVNMSSESIEYFIIGNYQYVKFGKIK